MSDTDVNVAVPLADVPGASLVEEVRQRIARGDIDPDDVVERDEPSLAAYGTGELQDELASRGHGIDDELNDDVAAALRKIRTAYHAGRHDEVVRLAHELYLDYLPVAV